MGIKSTIEMGVMLFIGVIALKAFGGVQGLTSMFQGISGMFGGGSAAGGGGGTVYAGTGGVVTPDVIADVVEGGGTVDVIETAPLEPYNPWALLSPFATVAEWLRYTSQRPGDTTTTITGGQDAVGDIVDTSPVPSIPTYDAPPPYVAPPVVEPPPTLPSPFHPLIGVPEQWRGIFE